MPGKQFDVVVVANRLPADRVTSNTGEQTWRLSPGGLVTALRPVLQKHEAAWVGWAGSDDADIPAFEYDGMYLVPIPLDTKEIAHYYEGFSNGTLWPLYHDVIVPPEYHRTWWDSYRLVNRRFAEQAAALVAPGGLVWVHDYQLQLVPGMIRDLRPDVRIAFFNHIPFPPVELFAQLPWRAQILEGLLGADVVGFQRRQDVDNFNYACRRLLSASVKRSVVHYRPLGQRTVLSQAFPISIDSEAMEEIARRPATDEAMARLKQHLGGRRIVLGVDRLDYTKGIRHRLTAFAELVEDGLIDPTETVLVQIATPSRERVEHYKQLRDEIELIVGRVNGDHAGFGSQVIDYAHRSYDRDDMAALYRAADVLLVTSLRDGMNLVAKEYVASRFDNEGALVLSEFTGAAEEMRQAISVNPHDIAGLKNAIMQALQMPVREQRRRMRAMRKHLATHNVDKWARDMLAAVEPEQLSLVSAPPATQLAAALYDFAERPGRKIVAVDFDGTLAPLVDDRDAASALPAAREALTRLSSHPMVDLCIVSGRSLDDLRERMDYASDVMLIGGHGAEWPGALADSLSVELSSAQIDLRDHLAEQLHGICAAHPGTDLERKPTSVVLHTRMADVAVRAAATRAATEVGQGYPQVRTLMGDNVVELSVTAHTKGTALRQLRELTGARSVMYIGDDVTDEDAFHALDEHPSAEVDVTIKVGLGHSLAQHRVTSPQSVAEVLHALADRLDD